MAPYFRNRTFRLISLTVLGMTFGFVGIYVGETDDSPGAGLLGIILMLALVTYGVWGFFKRARVSNVNDQNVPPPR